MIIKCLLNGEMTQLSGPSEIKLAAVLEKEVRGINRGCNHGRCGGCLILFNGHSRYSCQIPLFEAKGMEITTIEGIQQEELFQDILKGFKKAELDICDFCAPARVLSIFGLLRRNDTPSREEIAQSMDSVNCSCTHTRGLRKAIIFSIEERNRRIHGRK